MSVSEDLFAHGAHRERRGQPLPERMRPRTIAEFVGQGHLLGPGHLLARVLETRALPSLILWGPPGTGKTTLAAILCEACQAEFAPMSAASAGVAQLRELVAGAERRLHTHSMRTVLFLDEIHRFNKGQQDALLPHVEAGTVVLIGATTENPSFHVNAALLSRCQVVRLNALAAADMRVLIDRALADRERGLGNKNLVVSDKVRDQLAEEANGDARRALGTLEIAASLATTLTRDVLAEALQKKTLLYDKSGDEHYNVVSVFIKALRGSDPDAAVYWLARMLEAGEDPLFVLRRMIIFASEDIGNADPLALGVAVSALESFRFVGLPEGVLPLTQAVVYLACAPKSNTALTSYAAARQAVHERGALAVPPRFCNAPTQLMKDVGYGEGYKYPHDFAGHYVVERYLPDALAGQRFYQPSDSGHERAIAERLRGWRGEDDEA